jgi:hypothetical protein
LALIYKGELRMDAFKFMSDSPWLTFFLVLIVGEVVVRVVVNLPNRILRHWNIRKHGYPPVHCDADGDFRPEKDA